MPVTKNLQTYSVGGYVRDRLLGVPGKDRDWVVIGATVEQMLALGFEQVGKDFPVFLHPQTKDEYALARTERKTAPGYKGFQVYAAADVSLEDDLLRRDLTINAMAMDEHDTIIDPFNGRDDLRQRLLRHVSLAFTEDPVRILRVARFVARLSPFNFRVAPQTMALMQTMVRNNEVDALTAERVWQEIDSALQTSRPDLFFQVLRRCGALQRLLPELDGLFGIPQSIRSHPEIDCGIHTLMVLRQAVLLSDDPTVRFAALTHDLGKGVTAPALWPKHTGHELQSVALLEQVCRRLKVPNEYYSLARIVARYHGACHNALDSDAQGIVDLFDGLDIWRRPQRLQAFVTVCTADSRGRSGFEQSDYPQAAFVTAMARACLDIDKSPLLDAGYKGADFGKALRALRITAVEQAMTVYGS